VNMATAMVTRRARKEPFPAMASSVAEKISCSLLTPQTYVRYSG
jgi:hypothetical protein